MKSNSLVSSNGKHILDDALQIISYPPEIIPVEKRVDSTAFFPGGIGIYENSNTEIDILVLGQDFGTLSYHKALLKGKKVDTNCPTWIHMTALFNSVSIDLKNRCFYSNVFMGLRKEDKMTGPLLRIISNSADRKTYKESCVRFLQNQIKIIRPKAVITLGNEPIKMLFEAACKNISSWKRSTKATDSNSIVKAIFGDFECYCLALLHPSLRHSNLHYRKSTKSEDELLSELLKLIQ